MPSCFRSRVALIFISLLSGAVPASAGSVLIVAPPVRMAPAPVVVVPPPYYYAPPPVAVVPYPVAPVVLPIREPRCQTGGVVYAGPKRTVAVAGRRCW